MFDPTLDPVLHAWWPDAPEHVKAALIEREARIVKMLSEVELALDSAHQKQLVTNGLLQQAERDMLGYADQLNRIANV